MSGAGPERARSLGWSVAVTGADGFLGSALCAHLLDHGYGVRALVEEQGNAANLPAGVELFACTLPDRVDPAAFQGLHVLVHCAFDTRFRDEQQARAVNVEGSRRVFGAARDAGVQKVVFISSLSAHEQAVSVYGRSKLEVEGLLDLGRDVAIRPGTIIGSGGVFWRQAQSIAVLPFIPLFYGGRQRFQTVWLEDVCEGVRVAIEKDLAGVLSLAEREPVELRDFYAAIARALGKRPRFLALPGDLTCLALRIAERLGFSLPLSSDNLLGLKHLRAVDLTDDLNQFGVTPRTMSESLARIEWSELSRT
jgi:NADH dehydrogenase